MTRPVGLWWERKMREWKATPGDLPERCDLTEKYLFVLWSHGFDKSFSSHGPISSGNVVREFARESEILWAAPAVVSCHVNHSSACHSSLLGSWQEVLLIRTFSEILRNLLYLYHVHMCVYMCVYLCLLYYSRCVPWKIRLHKRYFIFCWCT